MYVVLALMPVTCTSGEVHVPCIYAHSNRTTLVKFMYLVFTRIPTGLLW